MAGKNGDITSEAGSLTLTLAEVKRASRIVLKRKESQEIDRVIFPNTIQAGIKDFSGGGIVIPSNSPADTTNRLYNENGTLKFNGQEVGTGGGGGGGGGGSGGAVSSVANGADNRIATFASSDSLNGEANLTFDGSSLAVAGSAKVGVGTTDPKTSLTVIHDYTTTTFENQLSDNEGGGHIIKYGAGTLSAGKLYFLHTNGTWTETDSDAEATGGYQLLGVALGSSPTTNGVLLKGYVKVSSDYINGTAQIGFPVYVDNGTAGEYNFTAPSGSGDFVRIVGYCVDIDSSDILLYFDPDKTWVVRT